MDFPAFREIFAASAPLESAIDSAQGADDA
jgi:hypothetical protein